MDRVRFGRALGYGARHAVKTLVAAADAATAENPSAQSARSSVNAAHTGTQARAGTGPAASSVASSTQSARPATDLTTADVVTRRAPRKAASAAAQVQGARQNLGSGVRRFREAMWKPFVRLSGVLWLEVSGVFFGLFAVVALSYVWRLRGAWRANATDAVDHRSLIGSVIMLVLFGYFCVSNFVRARRRERGQ